MAINFNKVILAGNLTRDPEVRFLPKGTAVARIGLAVNRTYTTETGEKKDEATFVDVEAFGRQAELIGQYFKKGRPILIEGRLKLDQWEDKNTHQKQSKLRVVLEGFSFVDSNRPDAPGAPARPPAAPAQPAPAQPAPAAPVAPAAPPAPAAQSESDGPPPEEDEVPF
jgi:single-strand DNA-binding protein